MRKQIKTATCQRSVFLGEQAAAMQAANILVLTRNQRFSSIREKILDLDSHQGS
jgi:hypothetical protein